MMPQTTQHFDNQHNCQYQYLIDWCFNGTSTQKGQFVPTAGEGNQLSRLRMANEIQ